MSSLASASALLTAATHPWTLLMVQLSIFGAAATLTKHTSSARYFAIAIMIAIACYFHQTVHARVDNRAWKSIPSGTVVGSILSAIERLLLGQWNFEAGGPEEHSKPGAANDNSVAQEASHSSREGLTKSKFWFSLDTVCSARGIGRSWQVKNVPHFSSTDPSYVPSRHSFLIRKLALISICFIIFDAATAQPPPEERFIAADKQPLLSRLNEITIEEFVVRLACAQGFWINSAAILNFFAGAYAFVVVAVGISEPAAWPPLFGSPVEAYSIRQFWGLGACSYLSTENQLTRFIESIGIKTSVPWPNGYQLSLLTRS